MTVAPAKCTKPHVPTVDKNVKYHSSQQKVVQFTAEIATRSTDQQGTKVSYIMRRHTFV